MMIKLVLRKIGDSAGFYVPAFVIKSLGLEIGKEVEISVGDDVLAPEDREEIREGFKTAELVGDEPKPIVPIVPVAPIVNKSYMCPKHKVARVSCKCE